VHSSKVIDHLEEVHKDVPYTAVAYFYISYKDVETQSRTNLSTSLMVQLCGRRPDTPRALFNLSRWRDSGLNPPKKELDQALFSASRDFTNVYFVIDGLDECPNADSTQDQEEEAEDRRREILELFKVMRGWGLGNIHLMLISRPEPDIGATLRGLLDAPGSTIIDLGTSNHSDQIHRDMGVFIDAELQDSKFEALSPDKKTEVKTTLITKADGM
jgi:ankyrin repeat domain-containing protein 50